MPITTSPDECPYLDAGLAKQWHAAVARGDLEVMPCCDHIRYHHREFTCILCALDGKACSSRPKRPEKKLRKPTDHDEH